MLIQKEDGTTEDYLTAHEAAEILSVQAGRPIPQDYVRMLASTRYKRLNALQVDGRTKLYPRSQLETIVVSASPGRKRK